MQEYLIFSLLVIQYEYIFVLWINYIVKNLKEKSNILSFLACINYSRHGYISTNKDDINNYKTGQIRKK